MLKLALSQVTKSRLAPLALIVPLLGGGCAWLPDLEQTNRYAYGQGNGIQLASRADGEYLANDIDDFSDVADVAGDDLVSDGDPLEPFNRFMFAINDTLDIFVLKPVAVTYRRWTPDGVQEAVDNFLTNLFEPVTFVNSLLQGDWEHAETTASRFLINTAIGFGFFDPATGLGLEHRDEDFGQTLAVWGAPSGPYLVLPLLGPNSVRSGVGRGVDILLDPFSYFSIGVLDDVSGAEAFEALGTARLLGSAVNFRAQNIETLDEVRADSIDYYARIRSLWMQQRRREILNEGSIGPEVGAQPRPIVSTEADQLGAN